MSLPEARPNLPAGSEDPRQARPHPLVGAVWALLVVNTLGSGGDGTIIPIPTRLAQMITMGSLCVAFVLALVLNPRVRLRPNAFLSLLTLLLVISILSSAFLQSGYGALARCARLAVFVATLWLLTRWWGRDLSFVRYHIRALGAVLLSVAIGLAVAPGLALPDSYGGRLVGVLWYLPATRVGDYAAVVAGLVVVLWLARGAALRSVVGIALPALVLLELTHTRTATAGLAVGLVVAGLSLLLANARARRVVPVAAVGAAVIGVTLAGPLMEWMRRGQSREAFRSLTGREQVWHALLSEPRTPREQLLGVGLTDKSFHGLPIDSTWLTIYHEQGLVGVAIASAIFAGLIIIAATRPPSAARACAIFLIAYCLVASYTQTGIGDVSSYLLHLTLAAALLMPNTPQARNDATGLDD